MSNGVETQRARSEKDGSYTIWGLSEDAWDFSVSYTALCPNDRSYVSMYYPNEPIPSERINIDQPEQNHDLILPIDDDHDEMSDAWEEDNGLDSSRNDAQEDPDEDGVSNLEEYRNQSNPTEISPSTCGCQSSGASFLLPIVLIALRRRE
jgi:hypothetical protein